MTLRNLLSLLALAGLAVSCTEAKAQKITVKGSDTMVITAQKWAEVYQKAHPKVAIQVTGGGSGVGIASLINGTTDIANASRPIKKSEIDSARVNGVYPFEVKAALDGLAVVVNRNNPVKEMTVKVVAGIFTGAINNWKELGGPDHDIIRYCRENSSGTYVFFKEDVLKNKDYASDCQTLQGTAAVAEAVSKDPYGIGYGGIAYFEGRKDLKILPISAEKGKPAVDPMLPGGKGVNYAVVYDRTYPISRYLFLYASRKPTGEIKKYIDWITGPEGQKVVEETGYIPLPGALPAPAKQGSAGGPQG
jgi:phosphate transport system substrate-binding protein